MREQLPVQTPTAAPRLTPAEPEHWYRSLYLHSLDGILLTTPDGEILAANPAMCRMLGYEESELLTLGRAGVVDTTDPRLAAALTQRRTTGAFVGELTLIAKDGRRVPVEISTRLYRDATGAERTSSSCATSASACSPARCCAGARSDSGSR